MLYTHCVLRFYRVASKAASLHTAHHQHFRTFSINTLALIISSLRPKVSWNTFEWLIVARCCHISLLLPSMHSEHSGIMQCSSAASIRACLIRLRTRLPRLANSQIIQICIVLLRQSMPGIGNSMQKSAITLQKKQTNRAHLHSAAH